MQLHVYETIFHFILNGVKVFKNNAMKLFLRLA
jgi:hypothetical protein